MTRSAPAPDALDLRTALDLLSAIPGGAIPGSAIPGSAIPVGQVLRVAGLAVTRFGRAPGTAPAVMLVHGLGSARSVWAPIAAQLAQRYHVVAVDLPGHGASRPLRPGEERAVTLAALLARVCGQLDLHRPHVVGNSLGGWVGFELAADGHAASLTALAPAGLRIRPGRPSPVLRLNRQLARLTGPVAPRLLGVRPIRGLVFASATVAPLRLDLALARASALAVQQATGYEAMLEATGHARFERAADIGVPVTVVIGESDRILPGEVNRSRRMAPGHARWVRLPACGHAPMWDAPQRTLQLVGDTIADAEATPGRGAGFGRDPRDKP